MTYSMNGYGQYGEYFSYPMGACCSPCAAGLPCQSMGSIAATFNAAQVWADVEEGGRVGQYQASLAKLDCSTHVAECNAVKKMISSANHRGLRGANAIRDALRELGYTPGANDTMWGGADSSAWKAFTSKHGVPAGPGLVSKQGVYKLEEELGGPSKAGMGAIGWMLLLLAGGAATVALVSGRRKGKTPTGRVTIPMR